MTPQVTSTTVSDEKPDAYEASHVHEVYDQIASHFSSTRYKPWPVVSTFLYSIPTGWIGLDSGTGNGKYLPLPLDRPGSIHTIGMDRSLRLLKIAKTAGGTYREVVHGDALGRGWRPGVFDYAISIATIHHLATPERRLLSVQRLLESVSSSHGRVLIYVWATEQDDASKRVIPKDSESSEPGLDVLVPWVMSTGTTEEGGISDRVLNRYYHMFAQGELAGLVEAAAHRLGIKVGPRKNFKMDVGGLEMVQNGWDRSNYYVEVHRWRNDSP